MIDAIKEAIEAMDKSKPYMSAYSPDRKMIDKAIAALQALQRSGEPVALWSLRQLAHEHDGKFHGPNVEHLSIPEHSLLGFANAIIAKYTTPQPVVDVNQQLVEALLLFVQNSSVQGLVPVTCEIAEDALLSAGKGCEE
jgi:hypothetical protein